MIEKLSEKENIWDALAKSDKPAVIYGMGNGAEKIIEALGEYGVGVSDIFASDDFVRGHSFKGFRAKKYSEICEKYDDFNVILAFATHLEDVLEKNTFHKSGAFCLRPRGARCWHGIVYP